MRPAKYQLLLFTRNKNKWVFFPLKSFLCDFKPSYLHNMNGNYQNLDFFFNNSAALKSVCPTHLVRRRMVELLDLRYEVSGQTMIFTSGCSWQQRAMTARSHRLLSPGRAAEAQPPRSQPPCTGRLVPSGRRGRFEYRPTADVMVKSRGSVF